MVKESGERRVMGVNPVRVPLDKFAVVVEPKSCGRSLTGLVCRNAQAGEATLVGFGACCFCFFILKVKSFAFIETKTKRSLS
ncbi:MAG: hypothetical protein ONB43_00370 [candidate division KSB1 bacterium]|nr:hypothetical protein [candidate division KSB1 bacterium]